MTPLMRRPSTRLAPLAACLALGLIAPTLVLAVDRPDTSAAAEAKPVALGTGLAYRILGRLGLMHEGRIKPFDTVAREEIKGIYTRETIKLPAADGRPATTWTPVAALLDWAVRPQFWDEQPIIAVEYLPLKQKIFAGEIRDALQAIAGHATTPAPARAQLLALAERAEVDSAELRNVVRNSGIAEADGKTLLGWAAKIGEETRWLSPAELEGAQVTVDGQATPLLAWLEGLNRRSGGMGGESKLDVVETKALGVARKLASYRSLRDGLASEQSPLLIMPRPANPAMLAYTAAAINKVREPGRPDLGPLETEAVSLVARYLDDIPLTDRADPGTNPAFDAKYTQWLREKSAWVPLSVIRSAPVDDLARAGYPAAPIETFRAALRAVEAAELAHPGELDAQPTRDLLDAANALGPQVNASRYPTPVEIGREITYNDVAPFAVAPYAYLAGLVLLSFGLMATNFGRALRLDRALGVVSQGFYLAGLAGLLAGIILETFGFYLRIRITGWAPVTNMYETIIYVALVGSALGLIFECFSRRSFVAMGAATLGLVGTLVAASSGEMLDPSIRSLPPVLRSNLWLTIHVMTIVSSYAAFALAMMLGVLATGTYLVATYRRSASPAELAMPLLIGVPILGVGLVAYLAIGRADLGATWVRYGHLVAFAINAVGGLFAGTAIFALLGEFANRLTFRGRVDHAAMAELARSVAAPQAFAANAGGPAGAVAVLDRPPTVSRQSAEGSVQAEAEARELAMRHAASLIKPMATFIYRSMQVGILLVAIGTFLGGCWADVSWGRFWGWDPKETWALITLLVYLMPLHGRFAGWVNTFWLVMASLLCFSSVLMAWYGVNFVLGVGLHSYGFSSGTGHQGNVAMATLAVLALGAGAFWRRRLSSRPVAFA